MIRQGNFAVVQKIYNDKLKYYVFATHFSCITQMYQNNQSPVYKYKNITNVLMYRILNAMFFYRCNLLSSQKKNKVLDSTAICSNYR